MFYFILIFAVFLAAAVYIFMKQPQFGAQAEGKRLERIQNSTHYKNGKFQNLSPTPQLAEGASFPGVLMRAFFVKHPNTHPAKAFHFTKTELKTMNPNENVYVWMGHSSYFLQIDGKKMLVDPVFSGSVSPLNFTNKAFSGTDLYTADDIPELDYLIITHDHYDHLDYRTVAALRTKVKKVITGLGTGAHFEKWKYRPEIITELDWFESINLGKGFRINAEPARHFSGRGFKRDQSIWASFVLQTPSKTIYIGGDSGYDNHFQKIGKKFPNIDFAILEDGQYNEDWRYIHMLPGEQDKAMRDLGAKTLIPVHNSKFKLSTHPWNEPLELISKKRDHSYRIATPAIGEKFPLDSANHLTRQWWEDYP